MKEFILGILFIMVAQPIIDGITSLFLTWVEDFKASIGIKIAEKGQQIDALSANEPQYAIGFAVPEEEEEYEDDDL